MHMWANTFVFNFYNNKTLQIKIKEEANFRKIMESEFHEFLCSGMKTVALTKKTRLPE